MSHPAHWHDLGPWLALKSVDEGQKIDECKALMDEARAGAVFPVESMGKACCHLTYRLLDRVHGDIEAVEPNLEWLRVKVQERSLIEAEGHRAHCPFQRGRWFTSLTMAGIYVMILFRKDGQTAAVRSLEMDDMSMLDASPFAVVNMCRAAMLRAAWHARHENKREAGEAVYACQRFFRYAASTAPLTGGVINGDELMWAATMVKLSIALSPHCGIPITGKVHQFPMMASIESRHTFFNRSIQFMLGL